MRWLFWPRLLCQCSFSRRYSPLFTDFHKYQPNSLLDTLDCSAPGIRQNLTGGLGMENLRFRHWGEAVNALGGAEGGR